MGKELKEHINEIHKEYTIIDAHFDMLMEVTQKRELGYKKVIEEDFLPDFLEGGVNIVVASIFLANEFLPEKALRRALDQISSLYSEIEESSDKIVLCKNQKDIIKAIEDKKLGIILSFEGVEPLGSDLRLLKIFYELGVRIVGLVWSRRNYAADGCQLSKDSLAKGGGLTDFGIEVVREAENLGMFIDVSHLNDEGFWDVINVARKPVIASHSNSRALVNSLRNLTDDQIIALSKTGGVIGINAFNIFVSEIKEDANVHDLVKHVIHIKKLVGVEHVGLGFDFCEFLVRSSPQDKNNLDKPFFDTIKGHKNIKQFTEELIKNGFSDEEISLILGGNFLNLYKKLL